MGEGGARFVLREKLASIGDDYWIEDDGGNQVYRVDGKVFRVGKKAILEDADGQELYTIHHKMAHAHRTFEITRGGERAGLEGREAQGYRSRGECRHLAHRCDRPHRRRGAGRRGERECARAAAPDRPDVALCQKRGA